MTSALFSIEYLRVPPLGLRLDDRVGSPYGAGPTRRPAHDPLPALTATSSDLIPVLDQQGSRDITAVLPDIGGATHVGRVRSVNEDRLFLARHRGLAAVADGMGGHGAGDVASQAIVDALAATADADGLDAVARRLGRVNADLQAIAAERGRILGSTLVLLLVRDGRAQWAWCGDSRLYRVRAGAIAQLSRDHTEVQGLVDRGVLTAEEARTWPRRNVVTRAVGALPDLALDSNVAPAEPGDTFLLCSDGLTGHVRDAEILAHLTRGLSAQAACDALVALTLERGAADNVTVAVVRVPGAMGGAGR